tara:strand:+ start:294 stop:1478 length:1185 start_codon:yes stop_codon:yes gene_type:complete
MFKTHASNLRQEDLENNVTIFHETSPYEILTAISSSNPNLLSGSQASMNIPSVNRLGQKVERKKVTAKQREDLGVGGQRIGAITTIGAGTDTTDIDALRQGKNVRLFSHFSRGNLPFVTINTPELDTTGGHFSHGMMNQSYGQGSLFRTFDERKNKFIAFEDFPGRLDPVTYVNAGDYILQYMIITDLTRNVDKFIDPDTMDGVIEVFEVRHKFANTSFSDIELFGIRADMSLGDSNYSVKGSNFMTSKKEKIQKRNDYYEDSNETLFGATGFVKKGGRSSESHSRTFALDGFIHDEFYRVTPFIESSSLSTSFIFVEKLENFAKQNNLNFNASVSNSVRQNFSEIGSRFTASTSGFIFNKCNVEATSTGMSNNISGITIDLGTDSLAFGGFVK